MCAPTASSRLPQGGSRGTVAPLLALALLAPGAAGAAILTVGASAGTCSATSLAQALALAQASAADDEIRLTRTLAYTGVSTGIADWDPAVSGHLVLAGGFDDCLDATASGRTTLAGNGSSTVFGVGETGAVADRLLVTLRRLELTGGGRGLLAFGNVRVLVESSRIVGNGQGVGAWLGAELELALSTSVEGNVGALNGAGAFCLDAGTRLIVAGQVRENVASLAGGGIQAEDGCVVALRAGAAIEWNSAARGGGLVVSGGARGEGGGAGPLPTRIAHNEASDFGGGIVVEGPGPRTLFANVQVESNVAPVAGGLYVGPGGRLQLERYNFEQCANPSRCFTLSDNRAVSTTNAFGSAALVMDGGELVLMQGFVEGNDGDGELDAALAVLGGTMILDGMQIWNNESDAIFYARGGSIVAGYVSAAANFFWDEGSNTWRDSGGARASLDASIEIYTSILADHGPFEPETGGTIVGDCLILETEVGIVAEVSMVGVDPRFRDAAAGDLHLRPDSPAIDSCDIKVYAPRDIDFDLNGRGFDTPSVANFLGRFDRGADELPLYFADDFESGGTVRWSLTFP